MVIQGVVVSVGGGGGECGVVRLCGACVCVCLVDGCGGAVHGCGVKKTNSSWAWVLYVTFKGGCDTVLGGCIPAPVCAGVCPGPWQRQDGPAFRALGEAKQFTCMAQLRTAGGYVRYRGGAGCRQTASMLAGRLRSAGDGHVSDVWTTVTVLCRA